MSCFLRLLDLEDSLQCCQWDEFVESESVNGTLFHCLKFLTYHGQRFKDNQRYLMFFKDDRLLAVMPIGIFEEGSNRIVKSPFGASFGGLVYRDDLKIGECEQIICLLKEFFKENGVAIARITLSPQIYARACHDVFEFFLQKHGAVCHNSEVCSYLTLSDDFSERFAGHARRNYMKAKRAGLVFETTTDVDTVYDIIYQNRKEKFGVEPTHSLSEMKWLVTHLPGYFDLFLVRDQEKPVASLFVMRCCAQCVYAFYWAHRQEAQELRPVNFLFYNAIEFYRQQKVCYLDLGPQTLNQELFDGVIRFKESIGGRGVLRRTYLWKI